MGEKKSQVVPAQTHRLTDLVEVQTDAVVSRVLYKSAGGQITIFAFDVAQELSEHTSPFDAFVQVLEGRVELRIGGTPIDAGPGDLVLMPGGVPHALRAVERLKMLLTMYRR